MLNGILTSRRNLEEIFIYFNFNSINFRLFRFNLISRFNSNFDGFSRPGFNPKRFQLRERNAGKKKL